MHCASNTQHTYGTPVALDALLFLAHPSDAQNDKGVPYDAVHPSKNTSTSCLPHNHFHFINKNTTHDTKEMDAQACAINQDVEFNT
jgi:hypothetical protein